MHPTQAVTLALLLHAAPSPPAQAPPVHEEIAAFMEGGPGEPHARAPEELAQFGRLAGVWTVGVEMATRDGGWQKSAPGVWAFKYDLGGFAVRDLWVQPGDALPTYLSSLGRDYLLTSSRIYDVSKRTWKIAWMANGGGASPGADFGTFSATLEDESIVMRSPADDYGLQRVIFSDFRQDSFRWTSEYSTDGGNTWRAVMRMIATRAPD